MVTEINPDAWTIAAELDEERKCGKLRGYAHHSLIPVVLRPYLKQFCSILPSLPFPARILHTSNPLYSNLCRLYYNLRPLYSVIFSLLYSLLQFFDLPLASPTIPSSN
jgi:hypothetical protein